MSIIWTIVIGFVAGVIAKLITPGDNEPSGFVLTTILGIVGAFVATYLGQAIGWYRADEGAGLVGAIVGAVIVLVIWGLIAAPTAAGVASVRLAPGTFAAGRPYATPSTLRAAHRPRHHLFTRTKNEPWLSIYDSAIGLTRRRWLSEQG